MRNFKELRIWQKGFEIAVKSIHLTKSFPTQEKFGICRQISGAAVSIPANIAEGCSRKSEKDYSRFTEISLGSAFELETQLLIAREVNYGNRKMLDELLKDVEDEQKMLSAFISKLNK